MSLIVSELHKALLTAGVPDAEARSAAQAVVPVERLSELATKADLKAELAALKAELIKWNVGTLIAMTALFGGLVTALKLFTP